MGDEPVQSEWGNSPFACKPSNPRGGMQPLLHLSLLLREVPLLDINMGLG
jgi:hypothetical protein